MGTRVRVTVRIGTSGWSYDHWNGVLYPPRTPAAERLAVYAAEFETGGGGRLKEIASPDVVTVSDLEVRIRESGIDVVCCEAGLSLPDTACERSEVPARRAGLLAAQALERLARFEGTTAEAVMPAYVGATNARKNRNRVILEDG